MKKITRKLTSVLLVLVMLISAVCFSTVTFNALTGAITYNFTGNNSSDRGYAEGTITLSAPNGTYWLYWADDSGALDGYSELAKLTVSGSATHTMYTQTAIPVNATKVIAVQSTSEPENTDINSDTIVYDIPESKQWNRTDEERNYRFASLSDIHMDYIGSTYAYDDEHFAAALDTVAKRDADFIITSGDNINNNNAFADVYVKEWQAYSKILADSDYCNPIYEAIGNHELWQGVEDGTKAFIDATGLEGSNNTATDAYFAKDIMGDHFIFMSLEGGFYPDSVEEFSDKQLDWLEGLLKQYSGDGKNIYIIEHSLFYNYGAGDKTDGSPYYDIPLSDTHESTRRFKAILQEYKDTIFISGHTHISFDAQLNYSTNNDTSAQMVHNSSVGGIRKVVNGGLDRNYLLDETEGYIVDVYDDAIIFNGANLYYNEYNANCCYIVNTSQQAYESMTATDPTTAPTTAPITASVAETTDQKSEYYLKGSFNSWGTSDPLYFTTESNVFQKTVYLSAGTYIFKINYNSSWYGNGGKIEDTTKKTSNGGWVMSTSEGNCTLKASGGYYTFNFNNTNNKLNVLYSTVDPNVTEPPETTPSESESTSPSESEPTKPSETEPSDTTPSEDPYEGLTYTVVGTAGLCGTEWDAQNTANDMTYMGDGIYHKVYTGFTTGWHEFAVVKDHDMSQKFGKLGTDENIYTGLNGYDTVTVIFDAKTNNVTYSVDFADEYPYTLGDVNEDGRISIKDATRIQMHLVDLGESLTNTQMSAADVNADFDVNIGDVTHLQKYLAKLVAELGVQAKVTVNSAGADADVKTNVKENLDLYYRYSSYDCYQALKKAYYDSTSSTETLNSLLNNLLAVVDTDNVDSSSVTMYFENNKSWSNVYAYCWGSKTNASWPGAACTLVGTNASNGYKIYSYTVDPSVYKYVIFTNGSSQTVDTVITDNALCYYLGSTTDGKYTMGKYKFKDATIN